MAKRTDWTGTVLGILVLVGAFLLLTGTPRREASGPAWPIARSPRDRGCMTITRILPLSPVEERGLRAVLGTELGQYMRDRDWCTVRGRVQHTFPSGAHRALVSAQGYRFVMDCDGALVGNQGCVLLEGVGPDEFVAFATGSRREE